MITLRPTRRLVPARAALALALLLPPMAAPLAAQSYYGMSEEGRLGWNGTILNDLAGHFSADMSGSAFFFVFTGSGIQPFGSGLTIVLNSGSFFFFSNSGVSGASSGGFFFFLSSNSDFEASDYYDRWADHVVEGPDRWSLRADGRISKNGKKQSVLFTSLLLPDWLSLDVVDGLTYALRRDGLLATGASDVVKFTQDNSFFTTVVSWFGAGTALRADGALFTRLDPQFPLLYFTGGPGLSGSFDGETIDTVWVKMTVHPDTGDIYALRRDGVVMRGVSTPIGAFSEELARLPPPVAEAGDSITLRRLTYPSLSSYADIEILGSGDWAVLRGDGSVYSGSSPFAPGELLPGQVVMLAKYDGGTSFDTVFCDLAVSGEHMQAVRRDGGIFRDLEPKQYLTMPGEGYNRTFMVEDAPNLDDFRNDRPTLQRYRTTVVTGAAEPTTIPVLAVDIDKAVEELVVTQLGDLPAGVAWDQATRSFSVAPQADPGSFTLRVSVDDGVTKAPRRFKLPVKVRRADTNTTRNRKPTVAKVSNARALVGIETVLPLIPADRDGDSVTITPVLDKGIFALPGSNASYDDATRELRWTPELENVGKRSAHFQVSDGTATRKYRVRLLVKAPLIGLLPDED